MLSTSAARGVQLKPYWSAGLHGRACDLSHTVICLEPQTSSIYLFGHSLAVELFQQITYGARSSGRENVSLQQHFQFRGEDCRPTVGRWARFERAGPAWWLTQQLQQRQHRRFV